MQILVTLKKRYTRLPLRTHHDIHMQQVRGTKGELQLVHQGVHREHGSNKVHKDLHKCEVAACHHLLQHWAYEEPKPGLVDQLDTNWDTFPIALD